MLLSAVFAPYTRSSMAWRHALITMAGYAALAAVGLALVSGSQYASPIFPAAGFALAATLVYGPSALPAVSLGSLIVNLINGLLLGQSLPVALGVGFAVSLGAALQAQLGVQLVHWKLSDRWQTLEDEKDAAIFLLWGGLIATSVSATVGNLALFSVGVIPLSGLLESWITWYVGDSLGVLVASPIALALWGRESDLWQTRVKTILLPTMLLIALALTAFWVMGQLEATSRQRALDRNSEEIAQRVNDRLAARLAAHREALTALRQFAEEQPNADYESFSRFAQELLQGNPDLFALSINDRVLGTERASYEAQVARQIKQPQFVIQHRIDGKLQPAPVRPEYVPVRMIAPLEGNRPALGFDIFSEPIRRDAIERAFTSRAFAVTAPVQLVQEDKKRIGLLALMPFFSRQAGSARPVVAGFAVAVIKLDDMVNLKGWDADSSALTFQLTDTLATSGKQLLFRSNAAVGDFTALAVSQASWSQTLPVADRQWLLTVYKREGGAAAAGVPASWWVGIAGFLLAAIIQLMMLGITGRASQLKAAHDELSRLALYDPLTGLPNRTLFFDRLQMDLRHTSREAKRHALLYMDLDRFKAINDAHGHAAGDQVLREAARRMQHLVRENDTVARMGGDEFLVLLHDVADAGAALRVAEKLLEALNQPVYWRGEALALGCSIGLAVFPDHAPDQESLIRAADSAMYRAKADGRAQIRMAS
jgi:diguanylate cyclase (GGDEF)-like protein